jgi:uncharacterized protein (TIGR02444 family)
MTGSDGSDSLSGFALELYRREGVADACLSLQNRHDLDVNLVLFAAFIGAVRRQELTAADLDQAHHRVDAWHLEVVQPLRAVRQRLKTGPAPAPGEATTALRGKLARLEIEAEIIELDQLGVLVAQTDSSRSTGSTASAAECAAAAIDLVVRTHIGAAPDDQDRESIDLIAAQAQLTRGLDT